MWLGSWNLPDEAATAAWGAALAAGLDEGDTVLLTGDLGAGKSALARAILRAWTGQPDLDVPSPTYTLVQTYPGPRGEAWHADLYRLADSAEVAELGLAEAMGRSLCLIEWPDRLGSTAPDAALRLHLDLDPTPSSQVTSAKTEAGSDADGMTSRVLWAEGPVGWARRLAELKLPGAVQRSVGEEGAEATHLPAASGIAAQDGASDRPRDDGGDRAITPHPADASQRPDPDTLDRMVSGWTSTPIAGDASARLYHRLTAPDGRTLIRMDARAEPASLDPFLRIAGYLVAHGFVAPRQHARSGDVALVDDLGPQTLAAALDHDPTLDHTALPAVVDALSDLADIPVPDGLPVHDPDRAVLLLDPLWAGRPAPAHHALRTTLRHALAEDGGPPDTLSLRDLHAGNLIWRPDRTGRDRIGFLDLQDAHRAPLAYDLASLLDDARRDLDPSLRQALIQRFARARAVDADALARAVAVHSVQRNLRILGLFRRFAREGRTSYASHIPRVCRHIGAALEALGREDLTTAARPWLAAP